MWKNIRNILFIVFLLCLCSYLIIDGKIGALQKFAEGVYLPGVLYTVNGEQEKMWEQVGIKRLFPLYQYVKANSPVATETEDLVTYEMILEEQANDESSVSEDLKENTQNTGNIQASNIDMSIERLRDFGYLLNTFYTVDSTTTIGPEQLNVDDLLSRNMKISTKKDGPKILIFHTHSQESFADSAPGDANSSIVGMGRYLAELLNAKGIETLHHDGVYDLINGKLDRSKAYQMSEAGVKKILKKYPSIEVVIDLHRDGVPEKTRLITNVNGKNTAKIMFFNGLSRTKTNGDIAYLKNPYIQDNLAFSLQMQLQTEKMYPGFARRIYLKGYRYSLHMMPKSLLIEAGAQNNTIEEMKNAMELLANILYKVLL